MPRRWTWCGFSWMLRPTWPATASGVGGRGWFVRAASLGGGSRGRWAIDLSTAGANADKEFVTRKDE